MSSPTQDKQSSVSLALLRAASRGDFQAVEGLLASGADVNCSNEGGQTALILAAVMGHAEIVAHLIKAGADPQRRDDLDLTAFDWATRRGFSEVIQLLTKVAQPVRPPKSERKPASPKTDSERHSDQVNARDPMPAKSDSASTAADKSPEHANKKANSGESKRLTRQATEDESITTGIPSESTASKAGTVPHPQVVEQAPPIEQTPAVAIESELEQTRSHPEPPAQSTSQQLREARQIGATQSTASMQTADAGQAVAVPSSPSVVPVGEDEETLPQPGVSPTLDVTLPGVLATAAVPEQKAELAQEFQTAPPQRRAASSSSPLRLSTILGSSNSADISNKCCPKCDTVYQNTALVYCTRDYTALIDSETRPPTASTLVASPDQVAASVTSPTPTPFAVWILIAFVLGASAFAAYRLTQYLFRTEAPAPIAAKPEAPRVEEKPFFSVAGALTGMESDVPKPEYPVEIQNAGVTGPITVKIRVNKNGRVISAVSTSGDQRLRAIAVKAAKEATFDPEKLAEISPRGRAVTGSITYEFAALQTDGATAPATTSTVERSAPSPAAITSNADPNAPVVGSELANAVNNVPAADYPSRARRAGIGGTITVTIRVNRAGKVTSWRSSAGNAQLRAAAIKAARRATFSPEKLPGSGDILGTITYNFTP